MLGVVEVGLGNTASVHNMFRHLGVLSKRVSETSDLSDISGLVLPGVGSFDTGMRRLTDAGLTDAIRALARAGKPVLGICLGMQLLCSGSEEGVLPGLGIFDVPVVSLRRGREDARVPNVGWAKIEPVAPSDLFPPGADQRFYFTHSFAVEPDSTVDAVALADFERKPFVAALEQGNCTAVQFHPEKSHKFGMDVLRRFWELRCCGTG